MYGYDVSYCSIYFTVMIISIIFNIILLWVNGILAEKNNDLEQELDSLGMFNDEE